MITNLKTLLRFFMRWQEVAIGKMQRRILVPTKIGVLLLLYLIFSSTRTLWLHGEWRTFSSHHHGFTIDFAAQWTQQKYTNGYKNLDDLAVEFINVNALLIPTDGHVYVHHRIIRNGSLGEVAEWGADLIEITGGAWSISPVEESNVGVENYPALIQVYRKRSRLGLTTRLIKNVYVVSDNDAYIIQFSSAAHKWDESVDIFDQMLESFQLQPVIRSLLLDPR